jgi:hypothetical protein
MSIKIVSFLIFIISEHQAHKVRVGQNNLVISLIEDFGINLTLK